MAQHGDGAPGDGDGDPGDGEATANNACALILDHHSYASQEQLECGLGPDGVELCHWTVSFDGEQYQWSYSDVGEAEGYEPVANTGSPRSARPERGKHRTRIGHVAREATITTHA